MCFRPVIAAGSGYGSIASGLLLDESLDINARDLDGKTALIHACQNGDYNMALLLLITDGIDMDVSDNTGSNALMYATKGKHDEIMDLIQMKQEELATK